MMRQRFHLPSPGTAIAIAALFIALGGTSYAASQGDRGTGSGVTAAAKHRSRCTLQASVCTAIGQQVASYVAGHRSQLRGARGVAGVRGTAGAKGTTGPIGPAGPTGATGQSNVPGPAGATGPTGPKAVSAFTGRINSVPTTTIGTSATVFGAPSGISTPNGTESSVETLSPSAPITISNFDASESGGPVPAGDSITVFVDVNETTAMNCVIGAGQSTCTGGVQSIVVPAASTLSIRVLSNATAGAAIPGFNLLFGFQAST